MRVDVTVLECFVRRLEAQQAVRATQGKPFTHLELASAIDALEIELDLLTRARNRFRPKIPWQFNELDLQVLPRFKTLILAMDPPTPAKAKSPLDDPSIGHRPSGFLDPKDYPSPV